MGKANEQAIHRTTPSKNTKRGNIAHNAEVQMNEILFFTLQSDKK